MLRRMCLMFLCLFLSSVCQAQEEEVFETKAPAGPSTRWYVLGHVGLGLEKSNPYIRNTWGYSMTESPKFDVGARFRIIRAPWHGFSFFARSDLVYGQRLWFIDSPTGSGTITDRRLAVEALGEVGYDLPFLQKLSIVLSVGVESMPLYRSYSMSVRGFDQDLAYNRSAMQLAGKLNFEYRAFNSFSLGLTWDFADSAFLLGVSYGL
jgi:hypothetical protein